MLMVAGAPLSSLRDYQGFVSPTTGWHPWLMTFMPSALFGRVAITKRLHSTAGHACSGARRNSETNTDRPVRCDSVAARAL